MGVLLVSDTSVLIDLRRADLLDAVFALPFTLAVPDLLYERELRNWDGPSLLEKGLAVLTLEPEGVALAQRYRRADLRLSLPDAFALALAVTRGHVLLAGDAAIRALAGTEQVECHGVLWVFDRLREHELVTATELANRLAALAAHPRCRLPKQEILKRLEAFRNTPT